MLYISRYDKYILITISYNFNKKAISTILLKDNRIRDISLIRTKSEFTKKKATEKATKSAIRMYKSVRSEDVIFRYQPALKKDQQKKILRSELDNSGGSVKFIKKPLKMNGAMATLYKRESIGRPSYNNKSEPWLLYTDASIKDGHITTLSTWILSDGSYNREILAGLGVSIDEIDYINKSDRVMKAESYAGYLGLNMLTYLGKNKKSEWFCDNQNAIDAVNGVTYRPSISNQINKHIKKNNTIKIRSIPGSENKLADALAEDIRYDHIGSYLFYKSPAIENKNFDNKIHEWISELANH